MVIILDIEGTTTSISFVYERLFPYVKAHVRGFLERRWDDAEVQTAVDALRALALEDASNGTPTVAIPTDADKATTCDAAVRNVELQMSSDRKTTALKLLQGMIWRDGYATGELKGHVYPDVPDAFRSWTERGDQLYVYSSGSVEAQKLLFGHSEAGDLMPLLSGYFDTKTGPKKEAESYTQIAANIGVDPGTCLFLTDNHEEAVAAREAGMKVVISVRPGNHPLPPHDFTTVHSFTTLC